MKLKQLKKILDKIGDDEADVTFEIDGSELRDVNYISLASISNYMDDYGRQLDTPIDEEEIVLSEDLIEGVDNYWVVNSTDEIVSTAKETDNGK